MIFGLIGVHLYLVIQHGVSEPPVPGRRVDPKTYRQRYDDVLHKVGVPFWPDAAWKDVVFALGVGAIVLALAILIGPPGLASRPIPRSSRPILGQTGTSCGISRCWRCCPASIEDYFMVGFPLLVGIVFIALPFLAPGGERSPQRRPWAVAIVVIAIVSMFTLIELGAGRRGRRSSTRPRCRLGDGIADG